MNFNRQHKDRIFCMIFGYEKYKANLLDLYNALNETNYTNLEDLEITTMENAVYMSMKNDVSCIIANNMALFEHQSTWNPNMPLRGFMYFGDLFNKYISRYQLGLYDDKLLKLPTPQYYVLYNGSKKVADKQVLKLSDSFIVPPKDGIFEWTATVLNINPGHNEKLLSACKPLREYAILIATIKEYRQKYDYKNIAIEKAIEECINCNVLKDFLLERKAEAMHTLLTEYDEEAVMEGFRQRAYEEGETVGLAKGETIGLAKGEAIGVTKHLVSLVCKKIAKNKSVEQIADELEEDVSKIQKIYDIAKEFAPNYDVEKIIEKLG